MIKQIVTFFVFLLLMSCGVSKSVVTTSKRSAQKHTPVVVKTQDKEKSKPSEKDTDDNLKEGTIVLAATSKVKVTNEMVIAYIEKYKNIAKHDMEFYGIPASITLAQGILESGVGTAALSVQANNHFGIKCHKEWTGETVRYDDDKENECFRKYNEPSESFRDHSLFLTSRAHYSNLFQLEKTDYKAWARGLKEAGYATDPGYPSKLVSLIEKYKLNKYDLDVLGIIKEPTYQKPIAYTATQMHEVIKGDTLYSISKKYNISIDDLMRKNKMIDNSLSLGQLLIIK